MKHRDWKVLVQSILWCHLDSWLDLLLSPCQVHFWDITRRHGACLAGSVLNSVANVEYSVFVLHNLNSEFNKESLKRLGLFWLIVNVGNPLGSLATATMLIYVKTFNTADEERLNDILIDKLKVRKQFLGYDEIGL